MINPNFIKKLLVWTLLLSSRSLPSTTPDPDDENPFMFNSLCNLYGNFFNKITAYTPDVARNYHNVELRRLNAEITINARLKILDSVLKTKQNTLFKYSNDFYVIENYLKLMVDLAEQAKIRRHDSTGACGEAAAASIVNSLLLQLKTGKRETVQRLTILDKTGDVSHVFVLYKSLPIQSQEIDNDKLIRILRETGPQQKDIEKEICDEFVGFRGPASEWPENFFGAKDHLYGNESYAYLEVLDCTLPGLHKKFNDRQRNFIMDTLIEILSSVKMCNANNDTSACRV